MIAELLILQQLLDKTNMVTPPESNSVTTATSTYGKAEAAARDYADKVSNYLKRFRR